ncbi:MAG: GldG family protein [Gammaproteobacteria bacterium]|nr:GldG family protein [Gammaproteobacteria bacterium]
MRAPRRLILRAQSIGLVLGLLVLAGLAAWATLAWQRSFDWTFAERASLTPASRQLLATLDKPISITAFARPGTRVAQIERRLLERYQRVKPSIEVEFVNPDTALGRVRKLGITAVGELYIRYAERGLKLDRISESSISNALLRLAHGSSEQIVFITGHGEASPAGKRNYGLGRFATALEHQGFHVGRINLASSKPDGNAALVVIAGPQLKLPAAEVQRLMQWLEQGGNLLWLRNPGPPRGLEPLAESLGIELVEGTVVETTGQGFGIDNPTALVVSKYGNTDFTNDFRLNTVLVDATGFKLAPATSWKRQIFIRSAQFPDSWLMKDKTRSARVLYRPALDMPGPIPIAIAFTRHDGGQRAVVVGDTSFLANSFLGNGGNLDLGLRLVNWLTGEDRFLEIAPARAPDQSLVLSTAEQAGIAFGFLAFLPFVFLVTAIVLAVLRRRR